VENKKKTRKRQKNSKKTMKIFVKIPPWAAERHQIYNSNMATWRMSLNFQYNLSMTFHSDQQGCNWSKSI
jgi:hypothetical protein